ncbi:hypothetical protein H7H51_27540, partial [Mycolicibacterium farcinogenes]|nr:hypothetical protein [Mycolicibacterium farcinogenes]
MARAGAGRHDRPDRCLHGRRTQPPAGHAPGEPGHSAASIAWLGYDAPSGWGRWRVAGHHSAREG